MNRNTQKFANMLQGLAIGLIIGILTCSFPIRVNAQSCVLNAAWMGEWVEANMEDGAPLTIITGTQFSGKGVCIDQDPTREMYLFTYKYETENCFKCLVIIQRHHNVLEYKQSEHCEDEGTLAICDHLHSNTLYSLFRKNAVAENCPFLQSPYTFTYSKRGNGVCENPVSSIHTCIEPTKMLFKYNACPDKPETEFGHVEIQCIASWKDGNSNYLVVKELSHTSHQREISNYRCYQYDSVYRHGIKSEISGYKVFSSDELGSCSHVASREDSPKRLTLTVAPKPKACTFPLWMLAREWVLLNGTISIHGSDDHTVLRVAPNPINATSPEFNLTCDNVEEESGLSAWIKVNQTMGCKIVPVCMKVTKVNEDVLDLELYKVRSLNPGETCLDAKDSPPHHLFYTLINSQVEAIECPFNEKFRVSEVRAGNGKLLMDKCVAGKDPESFSVVHLGVGSNTTNFKFYSNCEGQNLKLSSVMYCAAFWKDLDTSYLVAGNPEFSIPGYRCFVFKETASGFNVSMQLDDCKPSPNAHLDQQTFKLVRPGHGTPNIENNKPGNENANVHQELPLSDPVSAAVSSLFPNFGTFWKFVLTFSVCSIYGCLTFEI